MPYISASIILQLSTVVIPYLERFRRKGRWGERRSVQYTVYGTVVLQHGPRVRIAIGLEYERGGSEMIVMAPGWSFES